MKVKKIWYNLPGLYQDERVKKVKAALEGTGIAKLFVEYGGFAGNNSITVGCYEGSECETREDIRDEVIWLLATRL